MKAEHLQLDKFSTSLHLWQQQISQCYSVSSDQKIVINTENKNEVYSYIKK